MTNVPINKLMPVVFVSHASPTLAVEAENGEIYTQWGESLPQPKAILVFSAHWETDTLAFGEIEDHSELIYDFGGFPKALYEIQYAAPGATRLIEPITALLQHKNQLQNKYQIKTTNRGLDHGVWVPFLHMWPKANIPILQMTMPHTFSNRDLFELGKLLSPLREQGVLICANGTLTHNLREFRNHSNINNQKNAQNFDQWVKDVLLNRDVDALLNWEQDAPEAKHNHPTPEHFRPLLIAMGAANDDDTITFPIEGFDYDVFSKRSVQFV